MNRRSFLQLIGLGGLSAAAGALFSKVTQLPGAKLIPYVNPPEDVIPGVASYYNSLCTGCSAGCGIQVKTREHRVKKIEGNPDHPVNQGGLCSIGQALPQGLYNPDRVMSPMKLTGSRGSGNYSEISWEEAIAEVSKRLGDVKSNGKGSSVHLLTSPLRGHMKDIGSALLKSLGSSNHTEYELFQHKNLTEANKTSFGLSSIPYYDIARSEFVLSFGADFLSTWISPINYSKAYGEMRQGAGNRGRLVQVEPRMTLTGANADQWVPAKPGTEGLLALAIANEILASGEYKGADKAGWVSALTLYSADKVSAIADVDSQTIKNLAKEMMSAGSRLALGGQTVASYTDGVSALVAINVLNHISGATGAKGGVIANPEKNLAGMLSSSGSGSIVEFSKAASAGEVSALVHYETNPLFTTPSDIISKEEFDKIPFIVSFSTFIDETSVMADIILPSHHGLEDWGDNFTNPSVGYSVATIGQPTTPAQFNSRSLGDIMLSLAKNLGSSTINDETYADFIKSSWRRLYNKNNEMNASATSFDVFWNDLLQRGGWWPERKPTLSFPKTTPATVEAHLPKGQSSFDGDSSYPYYMVLQASDGAFDGRGANLPWLQEKPDPLTSVVWGSSVEINPKTANKLGIKQGTLVRVSTAIGSLEVPAYLYEGVRPDTISISIGNGHSEYGGYANGGRFAARYKDEKGSTGVNPITILPSKYNKKTGEVPLNSTMVKIEALSGAGNMVTMEGTTDEFDRGIVQTISLEDFKKGAVGGSSSSGGH